LLVPLGMGAYLVLCGVLLRGHALRPAFYLFFFISGPGPAFVLWAGCVINLFSAAFCA